MDVLIDIKEAITVQEAVDFVTTPDCGGIAVFVGTVRNATKGKPVQRLFF